MTANMSFARTRVGAQVDASVNFGVLLLQAVEADASIRNHATVADLLAAAGNTEANFTNYARKTGITASAVINDTADEETFTIPNQTFASAGGASNNTLVSVVVFYELGASDAQRVPVSAQDISTTTDGGDLTFDFSSGFIVSEDTTP
jgi:hypothetical protein